MATPVTAIELLIGKIIPYFLLGLASMTLCVLARRLRLRRAVSRFGRSRSMRCARPS